MYNKKSMGVTSKQNKLIQDAVALHQSGQLELAKAQYKKLLKFLPGNAILLTHLGIIALHQGCLEDAVRFFGKSLLINPNQYYVHYSFGIVLQDLKRLPEALLSYDRAIAFQSNFPEAHYNRGNVLKELTELEKALVSYDEAILLKPNYFEAYNNRGNTLKDLKRLGEALESYDYAIALKPDYPYVYFNRGITLKGLKRLVEALESYERAIALKPDCPEFYYDQGLILDDLIHPSKAKQSYLRALTLNPDYSEARWASVIATIPQIFTYNENLQISRTSFANELKQLDEWFTSSKMNEAYKAVGCKQPFYLAYQEVNNKLLLSQYGRLCNRLMTHWQNFNDIKATTFLINAKIKIGIVSAQIFNHSVWQAITKGWLLTIDSNNFEIHIFYVGSINDQETELAKSKACTFTQGNLTLKIWAEAILEKNIEVLIYPEIGMDPLTLKLASLRLTPLQLVTWGHPETTGLPTIDYYLSATLFESSDAQDHYTEKLLELPNLGCTYSRLPVIVSKPDLGKLGLVTTYPILLCPGTLQKYAPQYDYIFVEIVKRLGKCNIVFFNSQQERTSVLRERLKALFIEAELNLDEYVYFIPWLKSEEFYGLLLHADVFLDSIGFSGFNTAMQAIDCGLPIVTREGRFMRGRFASGILRRMAMPELITNAEEQYIALVVRLVQDKNYNLEIRKKLQKNKAILYDDLEPVRALEAFLYDKCRKVN